MANYNYECLNCKKKAFKAHADKITVDGSGSKHLPDDLYEELVLFETSHPMQPTEEELHAATECPRCGSRRCEKTLYGASIHGYTKGYGWLDKKGIKRDMNRHKLANDDPYAQYREDGEVEHIDHNLKKEGQYDSKAKHYVGSGKPMEKAVEKAVSTPTPKDE
jgi:DNA-directed RNA polymerase subunit RPC12/RpoP